MALPFLSFVSAHFRRMWPAITRGFREGFSSRQVNSLLQRVTGRGVRRTQLLEAQRLLKGIESTGPELRSLGFNRRPDPLRLPSALTTIRRQYSFTAEVFGSDLQTGERTSRFVTVTSDDLLTRQDIESAALGLAEESQSAYGQTADDVILVSGMKAGALGTL